ncbi:prenyltransferase/squalene oxidase repeat-containing protein [Naumannella cuiyingiana]|uniref:Uncharacterized protein n=1 Tax=Naumannella cuiyingiana TaxID=1347891 RepID=A0A7Z0D7P1_9ACTN|nr:prenyltransferase/squalene oxidase repeat-containing protein [Naumannella cuiyingiana]NYI70374.1 hypothetical protein [Naumannella cuiyingiana]
MTPARPLAKVLSALAATLLLLWPALPAAAAPPAQAAADAGAWLAAQQAPADDPTVMVDVALGLVSADRGDDAARLADELVADAGDADAASAAKLAVLVSATGGDPANAGGTNLIEAIGKGTAKDGQVGQYGSAFGQAWAILAYAWAGEEVPDQVVTKLGDYVDPAGSGAFGFETDGKFSPDVDSTAMAIMALSRLTEPSKLQEPAIAWLESQRAADGSFPGFSKVNSTGLAVAALTELGRDETAGQEWLAAQQLPDGSLPAAEGGAGDLRATSQGVLGLTGIGYATLVGTQGADLGGDVVSSDEGPDTSDGLSPGLLVGVAVAVGAGVLAAGLLLTRRRRTTESSGTAAGAPRDRDGSTDS